MFNDLITLESNFQASLKKRRLTINEVCFEMDIIPEKLYYQLKRLRVGKLVDFSMISNICNRYSITKSELLEGCNLEEMLYPDKVKPLLKLS